ncbi:WW domain-containing protein [Entamoeba marina]
MQTKIYFTKFGYFNQPVEGFISLLSPFTTFVSRINIVVSTRSSVHSFIGVSPPPIPALTITSNSKSWVQTSYVITPILTKPCFIQNNNPNGLLECPMGETRFPFSFVLPGNNPPSLIILNDQRMQHSYEIKASFATSAGNFDTLYYKLPMLFHTIKNLKSSPVKSITPFNIHDNISISLPKSSYFTGEQIKASVSINLISRICGASIQLVGVFRCPGRIHTIPYNTMLLPIQKLQEQETLFIFDIHPSVPPTIITPTVRFEHFILVEIYYEKQPPSKIHVPISIVTSQLPEIRELYAKSLGVYINKPCDLGIHSFPPPPFPSSIVNSVQKGITMDNQDIYVNHIKRCVQLTGDGDERDDCYPFFESTLLPEGWITGFACNERYFIDTKNKVTTWKDPRDALLKNPQHIIKRRVGAFNILPICAEGLPQLTKGKPDVYCAVYVGHDLIIKTESSKGFDPIFKPKTISIGLQNNRHNVCLYLYAKGKENVCLGVINFDLSFIPFPSIIEDWFYIFPTPFSPNTTSGRIKLRIGYLETSTDLSQSNPMKLDHILTDTNIPFYPVNNNYLIQVQSHESRYEHGHVRMLIREGNSILLIRDQKKVIEKAKTIKRYNGKKQDLIPLIETNNNIGERHFDLENPINQTYFPSMPSLSMEKSEQNYEMDSTTKNVNKENDDGELRSNDNSDDDEPKNYIVL